MAHRPSSRPLRILLDTNAFLWWLEDPALLAPPTREAIEDGATTVAVSAATAYEIRTKASLGKLEFDGDVAEEIARHGFDELSVTVNHALVAGSLPLHHKDPFDRLLIGQARADGLAIATRDRMFHRYGIPLLQA